jgi:hypothetical protein
MPFDWKQMEPVRGRFVPGHYDVLIGDAARAGMRVLPVLTAPPVWASSRTPSDTARGLYPPRDPAQMAAFAARVVSRWGRGGSFWREHPEIPYRPVTAWQIWNEPNFPFFWPHGPNAGEYTALLRAVSPAIKSADPQAEVVTAGLADSSLGIRLKPYVEAMYAAGARGSFDTLAVHPYARAPKAAVAILREARKVMNAHGDPAALRATEVGWATAGRRSSLTVGERAQARSINTTLTHLARLRRKLGLRGVVYYDLQDSTPDSRNLWPAHAGLLRLDGSRKPGWFAFRNTVAALVRTRPRLPVIRVRRSVVLSRRWAFRAQLICPATATRACAARVGLRLGRLRHGGRRLLPGLAAVRSRRVAPGRRRTLTVVIPRRARRAVRRQGWVRARIVARAGSATRGSRRTTLRVRRG